jgi:hypothetical protein
MSLELNWEPPDGLVKRHFGHVTGAEVLEGNRIAEADARFDMLRYVIDDFTDCNSLDTSRADIEAIAAIDGAASVSNPSIRIAIVATHPEVMAASTAYANSALKSYTTQLFPTVAQARAWLGMVPPHSGDDEQQ